MTTIMARCLRWLLPVLTFCMALHLTACGDTDAEQREAFISVLQSVPPQSGSAIPALTESQQKSLGPYANDYAILTTFSAQLHQGVNGSLKPMLEHVSRIRTPQDYLTQRDALRHSVGALNVFGQQVQAAKNQADTARKALKQPDDVQVLYERLYSQVVTQPAGALSSLIPAAATFAQQLVQVGDYLQSQGNQMMFNGNRVQFETVQQAARYNELVAPLTEQQLSLMNGLQVQAYLLKP